MIQKDLDFILYDLNKSKAIFLDLSNGPDKSYCSIYKNGFTIETGEVTEEVWNKLNNYIMSNKG